MGACCDKQQQNETVNDMQLEIVSKVRVVLSEKDEAALDWIRAHLYLCGNDHVEAFGLYKEEKGNNGFVNEKRFGDLFAKRCGEVKNKSVLKRTGVLRGAKNKVKGRKTIKFAPENAVFRNRTYHKGDYDRKGVQRKDVYEVVYDLLSDFAEESKNKKSLGEWLKDQPGVKESTRDLLVLYDWLDRYEQAKTLSDFTRVPIQAHYLQRKHLLGEYLKSDTFEKSIRGQQFSKFLKRKFDNGYYFESEKEEIIEKNKQYLKKQLTKSLQRAWNMLWARRWAQKYVDENSQLDSSTDESDNGKVSNTTSCVKWLVENLTKGKLGTLQDLGELGDSREKKRHKNKSLLQLFVDAVKRET